MQGAASVPPRQIIDLETGAAQRPPPTPLSAKELPMKRQIAAFTFVLLLFLTACGGGEAPASSGSSSSADISQVETPPAAPTPFTLAVYP